MGSTLAYRGLGSRGRRGVGAVWENLTTMGRLEPNEASRVCCLYLLYLCRGYVLRKRLRGGLRGRRLSRQWFGIFPVLRPSAAQKGRRVVGLRRGGMLHQAGILGVLSCRE